MVKLTLTRQEEEVREKVRVSLTLFDYESWYSSSTEHVSRLLCHSGVKPGGLLAVRLGLQYEKMHYYCVCRIINARKL